jgi:hypothetical protein
VEALLLPENQALLQGILLYYVLGVEADSSVVLTLSSATTLNGQDVNVIQRGSKLYINNAEVIVTDIDASNGVIHVLDTVLTQLPDALSSSVAEGEIELSWLDVPGEARTLEMTQDLVNPDGQPAPEVPVSEDGVSRVTINPGMQNAYYRLVIEEIPEP